MPTFGKKFGHLCVSGFALVRSLAALGGIVSTMSKSKSNIGGAQYCGVPVWALLSSCPEDRFFLTPLTPVVGPTDVYVACLILN